MRQPNNLIKVGEQLDDLNNGLFVIQKDKCFKFGTDAVLLADFAKNMRAKRCMDLCTGSGIVPLLLSAKTKTERFDAIEIQTDIADMARRSMEYNGLSERIFVNCGDLKNASQIYGKRTFDAVTCNPPYMKYGTAVKNEIDAKLIARHEVMCNIDDVISAAADLLNVGGKLYMVHRPSRLADIFCGMRKYKIEPKRMRLVSPSAGKEPNLVLIEGALCGGRELRIEPELIVFDENGNESEELKKIYGNRDTK